MHSHVKLFTHMRAIRPHHAFTSIGAEKTNDIMFISNKIINKRTVHDGDKMYTIHDRIINTCYAYKSIKAKSKELFLFPTGMFYCK